MPVSKHGSSNEEAETDDSSKPLREKILVQRREMVLGSSDNRAQATGVMINSLMTIS
jgi:hypothetical protein